MKTRAYGVSEGFFELFGLPMTLGGFAKAPPSPNPAHHRRVLSHLAGHVRRGDRTSIGKTDALRRNHDHGCRRRAARLRYAAWRQLLVPDPARSAGRQPQLRRLHAGEARARPIERARSEMAAVMASVGARLSRRAAAQRASTWSARSSSRSSASWARFSSSCCRRPACCWCSRA